MNRVETGSATNNGESEQRPKMQASALLGSCIETARPFQYCTSNDGKTIHCITPYYRIPRAGVSYRLVTEAGGTEVSATLLLLLRGMVIAGVGHPSPALRLEGTQDQSGTVECRRAVAYGYRAKPEMPSYLQASSVIVQAMDNYFTRQASRGKVLQAKRPLCTIVFTSMRQEVYMNF